MHKHSSILRVNSSFPESSKSLVMLCYIRSEIKLLSETQYWPREGFISSHLQSDVVLSVKSIRYRSTVFQRRFSLSRNNEKFGATFSVASSYRFVSLVSKRKLVVFARKGVNFSYSIYCSQWFLLRLLSIWGLGASKINFRKGHFYDSEEASLS